MDIDRFAVIAPSKARYRLRVPRELAATLGWPRLDDGFMCLGIYRTHGELLCIAKSPESPTQIQKLPNTLEAAPSAEVTHRSSALVPTAEELVLPSRAVEFRAVWLKPPHSQLELQLSTTNTERLGWVTGSLTPIYAIAWSNVLILMSERRFAEAHDFPLDF